MNKRLFHQEKKADIDRLIDEITAKKETNNSPDQFISVLRADMLPASETSPARENALNKIDFKLVLGILISIVLLGIFLYLLFGCGRLFLENNLKSLSKFENIPTQTVTSTIIQATRQPTKLAGYLPATTTPKPTSTKTTTIRSSPTQVIPKITSTNQPTPTSTIGSSIAETCRNALTITIEDVGKTMCVQGIVKEIIVKQNNYMVIFDTGKGSFYWVTYDVLFPKEEIDRCYQVEGTITQIANSPILIFNYSNLPKECP